MTFAAPLSLLALLVLPLLVLLYLSDLGRKRSGPAALHPDFALLAKASRGKRSWRRHTAALFYLLAIGVGIVAFARPQAPLPVLDNRTTVILTMDVSLSMNADDIPPTRFAAAKDAAKVFVQQLPPGLKIGLVSFAGYAVTDVPPTNDHEKILEAIDMLELGRGTGIGDGLQEALKNLPGRKKNDKTTDNPNTPNNKNTLPVELPPAAIVLLTDGRNNRPLDPLEMAALARDLKVKVNTVGIGTEGGYLDLGAGDGFVVGFDAEMLRRIASMTGGQYFEARNALQLTSIYRGLGQSIAWTTKPGEITGIVAAIAAGLLLISWMVGEASKRVI